MSHDRRRKLRPVPAPKSPIDAAIDAAEQRKLDEEAASLEPRVEGRLPLLKQMHRWDGSQEVLIGAIPNQPTMLVWDSGQGAWRAIVLPEGSTWRVVPDRPTLWRPR